MPRMTTAEQGSELRSLLRRAHHARKLLRVDARIDRELLLCAVVWPSDDALELFERLEADEPWHERVPNFAEDREPCEGTTTRGRPCHRPAVRGSSYCPSHAYWAEPVSPLAADRDDAVVIR